MADVGPHALSGEFAIFAPGGALTTKTVSPTFFQELDSEFAGFADHLLVSRFAFEEAWPTWEMHPKGDELVFLLEGDTDFVLRTQQGETTVRVSEPGQYIIVPKGAWHTARPHAPTAMLFLTPGEGTENLESPPF